MQRAGRIIYNGAMVVSLLLCLGTVGVWVRSYWVSDRLTWYHWPPDGSRIDSDYLWVSRGGLQRTSMRTEVSITEWTDPRHFQYEHSQATRYPFYQSNSDLTLSPWIRRYAALGFEVIPESSEPLHRDREPRSSIFIFTLPLYFPTLLFALLPAHYFLRVRRRRRIASRRARGCCVFCGYDLRASAGRCPECGRSNGEVLRPAEA